MKDLNEFIIKEENSGFNILKPILRKTGWPQLEFEHGVAKSIDEDTAIEFKIDDYNNKPYISKITCNFHTGDPAHLRDLNGLVELFKEIDKL